MKILYIPAENEFDALTFEEHFSTSPSLDLFNKVKDQGFLEYQDPDTGEMERIDVDALEFKSVDPMFVSFVRDLQDYDQAKHENFYVVKEEN